MIEYEANYGLTDEQTLILTDVNPYPCYRHTWGVLLRIVIIQSSLHACIVEVLLHYDVNVYLGKSELCMESVEYSDSDSDRTHDLSSTLKRVLKKINAYVQEIFQKVKAQHGDK